jgi:hypothetical protein
MLRTSKYFKFPNLSASRSRFRIPRAVKTERYPFSRETNRHAIFRCTYKTGHYYAHTLPITFTFAYLPSVLLFPSPSRSMANTSAPSVAEKLWLLNPPGWPILVAILCPVTSLYSLLTLNVTFIPI